MHTNIAGLWNTPEPVAVIVSALAAREINTNRAAAIN
jgi:hypothetical protein